MPSAARAVSFKPMVPQAHNRPVVARRCFSNTSWTVFVFEAFFGILRGRCGTVNNMRLLASTAIGLLLDRCSISSALGSSARLSPFSPCFRSTTLPQQQAARSMLAQTEKQHNHRKTEPRHEHTLLRQAYDVDRRYSSSNTSPLPAAPRLQPYQCLHALESPFLLS